MHRGDPPVETRRIAYYSNNDLLVSAMSAMIGFGDLGA
jgi:hypothetical protein